MLWDATLVCLAVFVIGIAISWKDPPPPSNDDSEGVLRTWDGNKSWDEITEGWT